MNWIQIFDVIWLTSVLVLLFLIWRSSEKRSNHTQEMEKTLVDVAIRDADSVRQIAQANQELIAMLKEPHEHVL